MSKNTILTIKLDRLLDCSDLTVAANNGYASFGRFALLRDGGLWFGDIRSSHPSTTLRGWYWAVVAQNCLVLSARGAKTDGGFLFGEGRYIITWLLLELENRKIIRDSQAIRMAVGSK